MQADDAQAWSNMRSALWPDSDDQHHSEIQDYFDARSHDVDAAFIACEQHTPAGFIEINIRNFAEGSRQAAVPYLEAWYVQPRFRGRGLGLQLMQAAEDWAQQQGYQELASDTTADNHNSIRLHKSLGFKETERLVCFLKALK